LGKGAICLALFLLMKPDTLNSASLRVFNYYYQSGKNETHDGKKNPEIR
jgi:hypothetical protein